ncbi:MAG: aryl-sulfate sulfotransferase [Bacteroidetes bacterium]|nr:aryl-sulfate sulfotransferase [Bacteroidota bacterium]
MTEVALKTLRIWLTGLLLFVLTSSISAQTYNGYTLYFPQNGVKAYLIDMNGSIYHTWTFPSSARTCYSTYLLPGGNLLRTVAKSGNSFNGGPISGEVQKVNWNGTVLWDYIYSTTTYCSHHDIHPMPNGNVLLISYELKTAAEVVAAGCAQSLVMWPDKIVEIQPSGTNGGTVVWEWHAWDHLVQNHDATKPNFGIPADHPELLNLNYNTTKDWMHVNGIDYNADLDQIVFSSHALNEIYVIDHSTTTAEAAGHTGGNSGKGGDFLYRWGNPSAYGAIGSTIFNVVHDAHWIASDNPNFPDYIAAFNNKGGTGNKSCVDIISPPYNGFNYLLTPGSSYAPTTYNWRHTYSGNPTPDNGNSQQLPNGNMLVCIGMSGLIYEIDSNQNQVWTYSAGGILAQAFRYPIDYVTGIPADHNDQPQINLWPNPVSGILSLHIELPGTEDYKLTLTDISGRIVLQSVPVNTLDLSALKPGIYSLAISAPGMAAITKRISIIR